jgi:hypothetical protein
MNHLTPIKAIRKTCKQCTGNHLKEIRECTITDCGNWLYRMGRRPKPSDLVLLTRKGVK